jgi:hypothetical protein
LHWLSLLWELKYLKSSRGSCQIHSSHQVRHSDNSVERLHCRAWNSYNMFWCTVKCKYIFDRLWSSQGVG